jgi:hypothetical protein
MLPGRVLPAAISLGLRHDSQVLPLEAGRAPRRVSGVCGEHLHKAALGRLTDARETGPGGVGFASSAACEVVLRTVALGGRASHVMVGDRLKRVAEPQCCRLVEPRRRYLHGERHAIAIEAAWH